MSEDTEWLESQKRLEQTTDKLVQFLAEGFPEWGDFCDGDEVSINVRWVGGKALAEYELIGKRTIAL